MTALDGLTGFKAIFSGNSLDETRLACSSLAKHGNNYGRRLVWLLGLIRVDVKGLNGRRVQTRFLCDWESEEEFEL